MKKIVLSSLFALLFASSITAQDVQKVNLSFESSGFSFSYDENGSLIISSRKYFCGYDSDTNEPGLPLVPVTVRVPNGCKFDNFSYTDSRSKILDGVVIAANTAGVPTNTVDTQHVEQVLYKEPVYPSANVRFVEESEFDGYTILRFLVCPFVYDAKASSLDLLDNVALDIKFTPSTVHKIEGIREGANTAEIMNSLVANPEIASDISRQTVASTSDFVPQVDTYKYYDYVIITSSDLANSFKPLASWKTRKGIKAKIVTVEEIVAEYPKKDVQLSIKSYLYDMYKTYGLMYALLGGDDSIVPVRGCYCKGGKDKSFREDYNIPTDLYYSSFGGDFSWDANGNDIYGEANDNISMDPSIFVTRAPVRTSQDVETFVNRIINYEKNPDKNGWDNSILMAGYKLSDIYDGHSDAEIKGDVLYEDYIGHYWNGNRTKFYDTCSEANNGSGCNLNFTNLQNELKCGYTFVDMITHANPVMWQLDNSYYVWSHAQELVNPQYTIITTMSCSTNAFDSFIGDNGRFFDDPCLSESFIRNPNSGVIAYLGCSREGWYSRSYSQDLKYSLQYESLFYEKLLSKPLENKNFGKIVAAVKQDMIPFCTDYNSYRWIQYGLNPIGDPEMPIFIDSPKTFDKKVRWRKSANGYYLPIGVDNCNVCCMSIADEGKSVYYIDKNVNMIRIPNLNNTYSVCVTKQGYKPWVFVCTPNSLSKNEIISCLSDKTNGTVSVTTSIDNEINEAKLVLLSLNGEKLETMDVDSGTSTTNIDVSKLKSAINIVSLFVEGQVVDSKKLQKK